MSARPYIAGVIRFACAWLILALVVGLALRVRLQRRPPEPAQPIWPVALKGVQCRVLHH